MNTAEHLAGEPAISVIVPIYNVEPYLGEWFSPEPPEKFPAKSETTGI